MTTIIKIATSTSQKPRCQHCHTFTLPTEVCLTISRGPIHKSTCLPCAHKEGPITQTIINQLFHVEPKQSP
jgi:hypothetical protein